MSPSSISEPGSEEGAAAADDDDALVYTGTGVILALAVDADDNLVFTMEDVPAINGGVFLLQMAPGGVVLGREQGHTEATASADDPGHEGDSPSRGSHRSRLPSSGDNDQIAPAVALAAGLGPFLPGVAVCPVTGDVYVTRGHTGIARLVKGAASASFSTKVRFHITVRVIYDCRFIVPRSLQLRYPFWKRRTRYHANESRWTRHPMRSEYLTLRGKLHKICVFLSR